MSALAFQVDGVYAVTSARLLIELVLTDCPVSLTFKQEIKGFFFILNKVKGKSLDVDLSLSIVLDLD